MQQIVSQQPMDPAETELPYCGKSLNVGHFAERALLFKQLILFCVHDSLIFGGARTLRIVGGSRQLISWKSSAIDDRARLGGTATVTAAGRLVSNMTSVEGNSSERSICNYDRVEAQPNGSKKGFLLE